MYCTYGSETFSICLFMVHYEIMMVIHRFHRRKRYLNEIITHLHGIVKVWWISPYTSFKALLQRDKKAHAQFYWWTIILQIKNSIDYYKILIFCRATVQELQITENTSRVKFVLSMNRTGIACNDIEYSKLTYALNEMSNAILIYTLKYNKK